MRQYPICIVVACCSLLGCAAAQPTTTPSPDQTAEVRRLAAVLGRGDFETVNAVIGYNRLRENLTEAQSEQWGIDTMRQRAAQLKSAPRRPPHELPTNQFVEHLCDVDAQHGLAISDGALYAMDGGPLKWKIVAVLPPGVKDARINGADGGTCLISYADGQTPNSMMTLAACSPADGFRKLKDIPNGLCTFASARVGCFADGDNVVVTQDGGQTWTPWAPPWPREEKISALRWTSPSELLIGDSRGAVLDVTIDDRGGHTIKWAKEDRYPPVDVTALAYDSSAAEVWIGGGPMLLECLALSDGNVIQKLFPDNVTSLNFQGDRMYGCGLDDVHIWNISKGQVTTLTVLHLMNGIEAVLPRGAGKPGVILLHRGNYALAWDGKSDRLEPAYLEVDNEPIAKADAQRGPVDSTTPTMTERVQADELTAWLDLAANQRLQQQLQEADAAHPMNQRQTTQWMIEHARQILTTQPADQ